MLSKALELWAFRVAVLCKSVQAKAAAMSSLLVGLVLAFVYHGEKSIAVSIGSLNTVDGRNPAPPGMVKTL